MPNSPITDIAAQVIATLCDRGETLACAESMTGGLLAATLTEIPGASACFDSAFVTYSITAKIRHLNVDPLLIDTTGLYSSEVAQAMAQGARNTAGSDWALAVSGLAGPDGGRDEIPVGTVALALAGNQIDESELVLLNGSREMIRQQACELLLNKLLHQIAP